MKKEKENKKSICTLVFAIAVAAALVGGFVSAFLYMNMNVSSEADDGFVYKVDVDRSWRDMVLAGKQNPGSGETGFHYFMVYPHQAVPATAYASELDVGDAFQVNSGTSGAMSGETPHSTLFDFVLCFQVNKTVGFNTTSDTWETDWVRAYISVTFDFSSDISNAAMTIVQIGSPGAEDTEALYHAYVNNAGDGYEITHDEQFSVTSVRADGYY